MSGTPARFTGGVTPPMILAPPARGRATRRQPTRGDSGLPNIRSCQNRPVDANDERRQRIRLVNEWWCTHDPTEYLSRVDAWLYRLARRRPNSAMRDRVIHDLKDRAYTEWETRDVARHS